MSTCRANRTILGISCKAIPVAFTNYDTYVMLHAM
jgi:hypothetical protein